MKLDLTESVKGIILAFFLLILPLLIILIGVIVGVETILGQGWTALYYILAITWFGSGVIFFGALR